MQTAISSDSPLDRITIPDILDNYNMDHRGSRACCPIHGGNNRNSFSFTDEVFQCFSCGAKGGKLDLIQALAKVDRPTAIQIMKEISGFTPILGTRKIGNFTSRQPYTKPIDPKIHWIEEEIRLKTEMQDKLTDLLSDLRKNIIKNISEDKTITLMHSCEYSLEILDSELAELNHQLNTKRRKKSR